MSNVQRKKVVTSSIGDHCSSGKPKTEDIDQVFDGGLVSGSSPLVNWLQKGRMSKNRHVAIRRNLDSLVQRGLIERDRANLITKWVKKLERAVVARDQKTAFKAVDEICRLVLGM